MTQALWIHIAAFDQLIFIGLGPLRLGGSGAPSPLICDIHLSYTMSDADLEEVRDLRMICTASLTEMRTRLGKVAWHNSNSSKAALQAGEVGKKIIESSHPVVLPRGTCKMQKLTWDAECRQQEGSLTYRSFPPSPTRLLLSTAYLPSSQQPTPATLFSLKSWPPKPPIALDVYVWWKSLALPMSKTAWLCLPGAANSGRRLTKSS